MRKLIFKFLVLIGILANIQLANAQQPFYSLPYYYPITVSINTEIIVTNTDDSGPGSLRDAINQANMFGACKIGFQIPGPGTAITINSPLPILGVSCVIDGINYVDKYGGPIPGFNHDLIRLIAGSAIASKSCGIELLNPGSVNFISLYSGFVPTTYWVTNKATSGLGSLAQAIRNANAIVDYGASGDTISFNIPGPTPHLVVLYTGYPGDDPGTITGPVIIDGNTQPLNGGSPGQPKIQITNYVSSGLSVHSSNVTIKNLSIQNCGASAISISGYSYNQNISNINIDQCLIGNNTTGVSTFYNNGYSVSNTTVSNCIIGTTYDGKTAAPNQIGIQTDGNLRIVNNLISGNGTGISTGGGSTIEGNKIGTDIDGLLPIPNGVGINIYSSSSYKILSQITIGGDSPSQGNLISGNSGNGIIYDWNQYVKVKVKNNIIGTDISGINPLPNRGGYGIDNRIGYFFIEKNIIAYHSEAIKYLNAVIKSNSIFNNTTGLFGLGKYKITKRTSTEINGKALPNSMVQLFYDNGYNQSAQGKEFIGQVAADANGDWSYIGTIANPCKVTAISYDSIKYQSTDFSPFAFTNNTVNLGKDTLICKTLPITLDAKNSGATFIWSTGATTQTIAVNSSGIYYVDVYKDYGCSKATDTINIQAVDCDKLSGIVYEDKDGDCNQETTDAGIKGCILKAVSETNNATYYATTSVDGSYSFEIPYDNYDVSIILNPYLKLICPATNNYTISVALNQPNASKDFSIQFDPYSDLSVGVNYEGSNRLGREFQYLVTYNYSGAFAVDAQITLVKDPFISVTGSNLPYSTKSDSIIWTLKDLANGKSGKFYVYSTIPNNSTLLHKTLCSRVIASTSITDNNLSNNEDQNCFVVAYPFDPNEILVSPEGTTQAGFITSNDSILEYTINFQNTGTSYAEDIIIKDTLSEYADPATFEMIGSSFPCDFDLAGMGSLTFTFNDIMLVDSNQSEKDSHGFVKYRVKLKKGLTDGTVIKSKADIYFDLAAPVATNYAINTIKNDLIDQSIVIPTIENIKYNDSLLVLNATSTSGLKLIYSVDGPVELINDNLVFTGTGKVLLGIYQQGDSTHASATTIYKIFEIGKGVQTILFDNIPDKRVGDNPFQLTARGGKSGNDILFKVVSGNAIIDGNTLTITGSGDITVEAMQSGNNIYEDAVPVYRTFKVEGGLGTFTGVGNDQSIISLYPNPAKDKLFIHKNRTSSEGISIQIQDGKGIILYSDILNSSDLYIDNLKLSPGIYFVKVIFNDEMEIKKLIIE